MDLIIQLDPNTVQVGDLNTLLSPIERSARKKINRENSELLQTIDHLDMDDIYPVDIKYQIDHI
jgi:hypothetical protein